MVQFFNIWSLILLKLMTISRLTFFKFLGFFRKKVPNVKDGCTIVLKRFFEVKKGNITESLLSQRISSSSSCQSLYTISGFTLTISIGAEAFIPILCQKLFHFSRIETLVSLLTASAHVCSTLRFTIHKKSEIIFRSSHSSPRWHRMIFSPVDK